ncbi:hypothetical protein [Sporolactobacillus terrae]|uniref:hypothetical protein n=1 Tax=Sporolactobacillus terrae TaxID=269673 RepID=UPI00111B89E3|nr:hypothetical protein [Sporolactobacillus terrae]
MSLLVIVLSSLYFWSMLSGLHLDASERQHAKKLHWRRLHGKKRHRLYIEKAIAFLFWVGVISLSFSLDHPWMTVGAMILFLIVAAINLKRTAWAAESKVSLHRPSSANVVATLDQAEKLLKLRFRETIGNIHLRHGPTR